MYSLCIPAVFHMLLFAAKVTHASMQVFRVYSKCILNEFLKIHMYYVFCTVHSVFRVYSKCILKVYSIVVRITGTNTCRVYIVYSPYSALCNVTRTLCTVCKCVYYRIRVRPILEPIQAKNSNKRTRSNDKGESSKTPAANEGAGEDLALDEESESGESVRANTRDKPRGGPAAPRREKPSVPPAKSRIARLRARVIVHEDERCQYCPEAPITVFQTCCAFFARAYS
jgi:hypothetical protein